MSRETFLTGETWPCPTTRKMSFGSRSEARRYAKHHADGIGRLLRPYMCRHCGAWHLTKQGAR